MVRNGCKSDFKKAFIWALREAGWGTDGKALDGGEKRLNGAVVLGVVKESERVLTAKKEELRREAGEAVRRIEAKQRFAKPVGWKFGPR